jgi:hypothetical protein
MIILYRCPNCHSVIERKSEEDEMIALAPQKACFICGICNNVIPASDVLSGRYDIKPSENSNAKLLLCIAKLLILIPIVVLKKFLIKLKQLMMTQISMKSMLKRPNFINNCYHCREETMIWEFETLLDKLSSEHRPGFVYRGQVRDYGALLPSGYRNIVDMTRSAFDRQGEESLHNRGQYYRPLLPHSQWPQSELKKIDFVSLCRAQLGYLLSQLFCQHCCLPTEGIDVSIDHAIAAFFAIFDYAANDYVGDSNRPGVIFRIDGMNEQSLSLGHLKEIDFYTCPFYCGGAEILSLLGRCVTQSQCLQSFREYFREKDNMEMTLKNWSDIRRKRPIELIRLPEKDLICGRVMIQNAGLVFPDSLLPSYFNSQSFPPPPGKTWNGPHCVEDLSKNNAVQVFYFHQKASNRKKLMFDPKAIFPSEDPLRLLLSRIITEMSGGGDTLTMTLTMQGNSVFMSGDDKNMPR